MKNSFLYMSCIRINIPIKALVSSLKMQDSVANKYFSPSIKANVQLLLSNAHALLHYVYQKQIQPHFLEGKIQENEKFNHNKVIGYDAMGLQLAPLIKVSSTMMFSKVGRTDRFDRSIRKCGFVSVNSSTFCLKLSFLPCLSTCFLGISYADLWYNLHLFKHLAPYTDKFSRGFNITNKGFGNIRVDWLSRTIIFVSVKHTKQDFKISRRITNS